MKGATRRLYGQSEYVQYFNPRTREGCDVISRYNRLNLYNFNPRTREGCDLEDLRPLCPSRYISIHAPVKGATPRHFFWVQYPAYFNPRTREGCDCTHRRRTDGTRDFNPRTREGCDASRVNIPGFRKGFQSTHP